MAKQNETWAVLVVRKGQGGRAVILNSSQRGLFQAGDKYYNHNLKHYEKGVKINVTVRLSRTGRRMVQEINVR